tara:strand:+ start:60 stop:413 length:354 start_codon:yes stop_codon:yes gene_type:complete
MLDKNNYTPMSDLFDLYPKSLCRVSKNILSDSSYSSINNPQFEMMKSSEHESVQMDSRNRTSQLKRVKYFLDQHKDMMPWLRDLMVTSGIVKLYEDKYRKLMFEHGTSKHPFPEERL